MFKKNEESEWTRFSRALQAQPAQRDEIVEQDEDETVELSAVGSGPAAPEAVRDEPPPAPYERAEPAYHQSESSVYDQGRPSAYGQVQSSAYDAPPSAPVSPPAPVPDVADSAETVLGEGASLEGTLRSERSIRIRGFLSGEIESKQRVTVEGTARVEARIVADQVTVIGEVNGQIDCAGRVEIAPSGRVTGEVTTGRLAIQEGAFFQGQLTMVPHQAAAANESAPTAGVLDDQSASRPQSPES